MFDDLAVNNAPDVDEVPRNGSPGNGQAAEKRHRGIGVLPLDRHPVGNEVTFTEDLMMFPDCRPKVVSDDRPDLLPALSALRTCSVIDHVLGHEFVDCRGVTLVQPPHQLPHDFFGVHDSTPSDDGCT